VTDIDGFNFTRRGRNFQARRHGKLSTTVSNG
jgi:hypothetical protein